jgi:G-protein signaling modulator 2
MKMQGTRIEDQRSSLPAGEEEAAAASLELRTGGLLAPAAPTMPDEDFFSLICRLQGGRIDDQRAFLGPKENGGAGAGGGPRHSDL